MENHKTGVRFDQLLGLDRRLNPSTISQETEYFRFNEDCQKDIKVHDGGNGEKVLECADSEGRNGEEDRGNLQILHHLRKGRRNAGNHLAEQIE